MQQILFQIVDVSRLFLEGGLTLVSDKLKRPLILRVLGDLTRGLNVNGINDFQYESWLLTADLIFQVLGFGGLQKQKEFFNSKQQH